MFLIPSASALEKLMGMTIASTSPMMYTCCHCLKSVGSLSWPNHYCLQRPRKEGSDIAILKQPGAPSDTRHHQRVGFAGWGSRSCTAFPVSLVLTAIVPLVSAVQGLLDTGLLQSDGHGRSIGQGPYMDHWNLKTKLGQGHIRSKASLHLYSWTLAINH